MTTSVVDKKVAPVWVLIVAVSVFLLTFFIGGAMLIKSIQALINK